MAFPGHRNTNGATGSQNYHRRCFSLMNRTKLQLHWGDGVGGGERTFSPEG